MKYISDLTVGGSVNDIYLCRKKTTALTKAGKEYESLDLQDKTGNCDGKIWEPGSMGIDDYNEMDYVFVTGEVTEFQGKKQINIKRLRKAKDGEYDPADYLPCSEYDADEMYQELMGIINSIKAPYMKTWRAITAAYDALTFAALLKLNITNAIAKTVTSNISADGPK